MTLYLGDLITLLTMKYSKEESGGAGCFLSIGPTSYVAHAEKRASQLHITIM